MTFSSTSVRIRGVLVSMLASRRRKAASIVGDKKLIG